MAKNTSTLDAKAAEKPRKMTAAQFGVALDEVNATLAQQIEEMRENQREIRAMQEKNGQSIAETRALIENL